MNISLSRLLSFYSGAEPKALLHAMIKDEFAGEIAVLSSFGAYSSLLISLVAEVDNTIPVLFLETEKHFPETLDYVKTVEKTFNLKNLRMLRPDPQLVQNIDASGELWKTQVNRCCWLRKVEPLNRELAKGEIKALITGRRQYQTPEREGLENVELFDDGVFRINPLANWSKDDIIRRFDELGLPQHPLVEKGYPSIGCAPCTRPVTRGEDERAGRWAHTSGVNNAQKTECGIHLQPAETTDWSV